MEILSQILKLFVQQVLPLLLLVALGYTMMRRLKIDIQTLNKLNLYVFIPGIIISRMLRYDFSPSDSARILGGSFLHTTLLVAITLVILSLTRWSKSEKTAVVLASGWGNTGNFGLPLIEMTLGAGALAYQVLIMVLNGLTLFTIGLGLIATGKLPLRKALSSIVKQPVIYALLFVAVFKGFGWQLPQSLAVPIDYLGDGMIPIAILTLGAQLAVTRASRSNSRCLTWAVSLRLIGAPLLMFLLVYLLGLDGMIAKVLIIGSSGPVAVNTAILAIEYKSEASLAARSVLWSTLLCGITLSVVIYLAQSL